jgi:uncharacterized protein YjbI with pentapeptide repeats
MDSQRRQKEARAGRRQCVTMLRRLGRRAAGWLVVGALGLLILRAAQAQGNPAAAFQQMQARIASLSQMVQRLNAQLTTERQTRLREQQQMGPTTQRLQRLQTAVNAAAAAGDPMAKAVRSSSTQAGLEKLAAQFEARARPGRPGGVAGSADELAPPDLSGARLSGAQLHAVKLPRAILKGVDLTNADLTNAVLTGANLQNAKLQGAVLTGVDLTNADLTQALYDARTRWPDGYDPQAHRALEVR